MLDPNPNPLNLKQGDTVLLIQTEDYPGRVPQFMHNKWVPVDGISLHGRPYTLTSRRLGPRAYARPENNSWEYGKRRPIFPDNIALIKRKE